MKGEFFHEFVVANAEAGGEVRRAGCRMESSAASISARSIRRWSGYLLLCATEMNSRAGIDRLVGVAPRAVN